MSERRESQAEVRPAAPPPFTGRAAPYEGDHGSTDAPAGRGVGTSFVPPGSSEEPVASSPGSDGAPTRFDVGSPPHDGGSPPSDTATSGPFGAPLSSNDTPSGPFGASPGVAGPPPAYGVGPPAFAMPGSPPPPYVAGGAPPGRFGAAPSLIGIFLFIAMQLVVGLIVAVALGVFGIVDLTGLSDADLTTVTNWTIPFASFAGWVVLIGVPLWVSRKRGSGNAARDLGLAMRPIDLAWGLLGWFGCLVSAGLLGLLYAAVAGEDSPTNTDIITSDSTQIGLFLMLLFVVGVGTPIAEEVFFRGLVFGAAFQRFGKVGAVGISSAVFGLMHTLGVVDQGLMAMVFLAVVTGVLGVVFALLRLYTGRLAAPIVAHMVFNSVSVVAITFLV